MSDRQTYAFDNAREVQRERLRALEAVLDAGTTAILEARGVQRGWRCLEVGAGGGSIAEWLCARVGPEGHVVATDLDTTVLQARSHPNLEVRVHDVLHDDLPEQEYDLVHLRLVLAWLGEPSRPLQRLVSALKPGGWLVAEEMDFVSVVPDPRIGAEAAALFARVVDAHHLVLAERNSFDPTYGRRLLGDLEDAGLVELDAEGRAGMWRGGEAGARAWKLTLTQLREPLVESGRVTASDVDLAVARCDDREFSFISQVTVAAWGRRPPDSAHVAAGPRSARVAT
jgi:2-polyprenyl-3-methyl-5-hydroxy-6-metoxy-1,4-benzoquinol methylase